MSQIAIITGASSGMGRETALQLADRFGGHLDAVWLIARRADRLLELEGKLPVPVRIFPMDITKEASLNTLKEALQRENPQVRFLVNSAGFGKRGPIGSIPLCQETGMIALNCSALCSVTHLVLPYIPEGGRVIQYASAAAFMPQTGFAVYAASKAFVLSYSRALRQELKDRGIAVTAVCPGPVDTEFFDVMGRKDKQPFYKKMVMAKPEKVVRKAIRDSIMKKEISIYGISMNLFYGAAKLFPHRMLLNLVERITL